MKKNILNRPMFNQVKSPAYGTGISANLVSNEQRQRYNYGGRVGLVDGTSFRENPLLYRRLPPGTPIDPTAMYNINRLDLSDMYTRENLYPKWEQTWNVDDTSQDYVWDETAVPVSPSRISKAEEMEKLRVEDPVQFEQMYEDWATKKYGKKKQRQKDLFTSAGITSDFLDDKPGMVSPDMGASQFKEETITEEPPIRSERQPGLDLRKEDYDKFLTENTENTEDIDTEPTAWETVMGELNKSAEEKKKLGKGNALMQAAAAAVKWSGAPTAEKRAAAISEGLTNVGTTAMKAAAEGMDLKNRAMILKGIEDVKGETDIKEQEMKGTQAMDRVQERIAYYKSTADKGDGVTSISDTFKFTLADPKISNDPIASINALQSVAQGEDININTETLDMSQPESLKKKFPAGTIIRDTKPNGKWYIVGEDGIVDQTKQYTYSSIGDWVESQASDKQEVEHGC